MMSQQKSNQFIKIACICLLMLIQVDGFGQRFGLSDFCQVNVHDPAFLNIGRRDVINATVRIQAGGYCSGTLINRNTGDNDVGFYILTAKHCVDDLNFDNTFTIVFNYQSPDAENNSVPISNRGNSNSQSTSLTDDDHEYRHRTRLRLVGQYTWGDMALLEILTPVPPHFNITYSGWNPSRFNSFSIGGGPVIPAPIVGIHHPRGDIKKISGIQEYLWLETPIATGCYTITTIIDVLFGWLWGNSVSTSVICNYVDNPWLNVPFYSYGVVQPGSSGSGIFNSFNRNFGVLSGGLGTCEFPVLEFYGKLHANYSNANMKNTFNPPNNVWVDLWGMDSRKIDCYDDLELPGAPGVSGEYFPANHYQPSNFIRLASRNSITATQPITVHSGAEYEFTAPNTITLGADFTAQAGSTFTAVNGGCPEGKTTNNLIDQLKEKVLGKQLPRQILFDESKYLSEADLGEDIGELMQIYPIPSNGLFTITMNESLEASDLVVTIMDIAGKTTMAKLATTGKTNTYSLDLTSFSKGVYTVKLTIGRQEIRKKVLIE